MFVFLQKKAAKIFTVIPIKSPSFSVHQYCDLICGEPISLAALSLTEPTILGKILNTANDKLVTQVLCFMFSPLLSNVSH